MIQELVALYQKNPDVVIGAGTVLDATTARLAIVAGAEYIVSPSFDEETAKICNLYQVPYLPLYDHHRNERSTEKRSRYY